MTSRQNEWRVHLSWEAWIPTPPWSSWNIACSRVCSNSGCTRTFLSWERVCNYYAFFATGRRCWQSWCESGLKRAWRRRGNIKKKVVSDVYLHHCNCITLLTQIVDVCSSVMRFTASCIGKLGKIWEVQLTRQTVSDCTSFNLSQLAYE